MQQFFKNNLTTVILLLLLGVLFFSPQAKAYLLRAILHTGVFNANTQKSSNVTNVVVLASLSFADKNGTRINTSDLKGKIIFINFWATWCPPCLAEMGALNTLYNKLKTDPRFVFILVDADSNLPMSTAFMHKQGYSLPVYQLTSPIATELFSGTLPTTLIIDTTGRLVHKHEGIANYNTPEMLAFLKSL